MSSRPSSGSMVYWRFKKRAPCSWYFGYVTYEGSLVRMGRWNGDTMGGSIVDPAEIEWKDYR